MGTLFLFIAMSVWGLVLTIPPALILAGIVIFIMNRYSIAKYGEALFEFNKEEV